MQWYPDQDKTTVLLHALDNAGRSWDRDCVTDDFYQQISTAIHRLVELAQSDPYLIRDWVWIAAQLRVAHPDDEPTARAAWGGLIVFLDLMSTEESADSELLPTLRWLTDRVIEDLIESTGPHAVDRFVSSAEQAQIDDLLLDLAEASEPDLQTLLRKAERVADDLSSVHHLAYFPGVAAKLRGLARLAGDPSEAGYWARVALRYVYMERDVVDDTHGYIGYLDDIQVIEDMHDLIHGKLSWRPLMDHAVSMWPMLSRIHWKDGKTTNHLPPFLKSTAACALDAVLDDKPERVIVTPEVGPLGFISAALCALADIKTELRTKLPQPGTVVTFRDGHLTRFAVMEQPFDAGNGVSLPVVQLRDAKISIPAQHAALLEPATVDDPQLATSKQINKWMRNVEGDQLTPVWRYRRAGVRPSVLYVTDRSRFFAMMDQVRPFGRRLDELVPVAYHTRGVRTTIGSGAATVAPAMIVCNDLATAETSLKAAADEDRVPRYVMIDRPVDPDTLRSLAHRCRQLDLGIRVVTFTVPEAARNLAPDEQSASIWLIRPEEIDPIPDETASRGVRTLGRGPLATFNRRQVSAADVVFQTVPVKLDELDHFATLADRIAWRARREQNRELETIAIAGESALRQISNQPPLGPRLLNERIETVLTSLGALAGVHGLFDSEVAELGDAAAALTEKLRGAHPKDQPVCNLLETYPDAHVLVGSRALAEEMNERVLASPQGKPRFVVPHDLEQTGTIGVLIVPSWFGTQNMRRLQFGGWAPLQIRVLFPYEIARLERLNGRLAREFGNLARRTRRSWQLFSKANPDVGAPPKLPSQDESDPRPIPLRGQPPDTSAQDDDTDWLETAIRNRINAPNQASTRRDIVTARLVFFDDGQHYGVFAKDASLICLNEVLGGGSDLSGIGEREAEKLLWKKVNSLAPGDILAFPDDPAYGDVIDGLADALIGDQGETRRVAGLWRVAVRAVVAQCGWDLEQARQHLASVGVKREVSTLASWLYSTKTVAPKKPAETIPALLACAATDNLAARSEEILAAASAVYAARKKAGHVLVTQLSSASISAASGTAYVNINGNQVRYRLLTVATVEGTAPFASDVLGLHTTEDELRESTE